MANIVTLADIQNAHKRINKYIHKTPVITSKSLNAMSKKELYFKAENLQKTGSFKARGAFNAVLALKEKGYLPGVGTVAVELLEQVPDLDAILVPVGGGGLISGVAIAAKAIKPSIKIFAAEPDGKNLQKCLETGERLWPNPPQYITTVGEDLWVQQLGHLNWTIAKDLVEKTVFTVPDYEMIVAMKLTLERLKVVIEASSAVCIAAVISEEMKQLDPSIVKIGVILTGGNVDFQETPWLTRDFKYFMKKK